MKQIIFVFMALLVSTGIALAQDEGGASIIVTENTHDFGEVNENGGNVSHTFTVKNDGTKPLVVTRVIASCGCTTPEWTREPIEPGKTGQVKVTFNPKNRPGPFTKSVSIYSNGKKGSYVVTIRGDVKQ